MNGLTAHCNWQQGRLHQDPGKHTCLPSVSSPKTANHPILLRSHSTRESAQSPGESGVDLQQPDWCPRSECWRNSGSYPLQSSNSTGCKWRPLHASQHPMPPRDPTVRHNTSSSSAGPVSIGRGPACSSSRLAQLSSECVAGIRKASRGKGSPPLGGSSFSMRNVEKNGCSTHSRPSLNNGGSTYYPLSTPTPPPKAQSCQVAGMHCAVTSRDQPTPNDHDNGLCMQGCQGCRRETTLNTLQAQGGDHDGGNIKGSENAKERIVSVNAGVAGAKET